MSWESLFDASTCTLSVTRKGVSLWTGILGKGQSSPSFYGVNGATEPMVLSVDATGVVALAWQAGATAFGDGYIVSAQPSNTQVLLPGAQALGVSCYIASTTQVGAAADVTVPPLAVPLTFTGTPPATLAMAPNPAVLSALSSPLTIAVGMGSTAALDPNLLNGRYLLIPFSDNTDYSPPGFNDSAWSLGMMPLSDIPRPDAQADGFPLNPAVIWPTNQNAWFRYHINVPTPKNLQLTIFLDDAAIIYVNGVQVFSQTVGSGAPIYYWSATIPASAFSTGDNVIACKCRADIYGVHNYVSFRLLSL